MNIWNLAEEIDGEQINLYLMAKKLEDAVSLDTCWNKVIDRKMLFFSDWDLETEYNALVQAFDIDAEQAEIYYAQKIYRNKLTSGSFADPDIAKACNLLVGAFG